MADMTVSFAGQANGAGDNRALFLKVFGGEVLKALRETLTYAPRTISRTISSGN